MATNARVARQREYYDDPDFNYEHWWRGRSYEHEAEVIAIRKLLGDRRFGHAVDVGGGYGRLSVLLSTYADKVTLVDPSSQQLELSQHFLERHPDIDRRRMAATEMKFPDASVDLVTMIRVLHHLPDPRPELAELARILRSGGYAIIEAANSRHAIRRLRSLLRLERIPASAVDTRSDEGKRRGAAPYVNHNPDTVASQITAAGLHVERMLSVSNLRHVLFKEFLSERAMLAIERTVQEPLAGIQFGPSIFFLAKK
jgi:ubiquinone/menaquinone biosynthesis C-methylase UbiE